MPGSVGTLSPMSKLLIHIGYPKAGSTFLQAWFGNHPQLKFRHGGVMGFANVYQMAEQAATYSTSVFEYYVTSYECLSILPLSVLGHYPVMQGTADPFYPTTQEHQAQVCRLLKDLFPQSRILIVTRGFKAGCRSGYSEFVRQGGLEHPRRFFKYIAQGTPESIQAW